MGSTRHSLQVRVADDLVLDAGWWEELPRSPNTGCSMQRYIHPPDVTLFDQVLAYLSAQPKPARRYIRISQGERCAFEAIAATAVCLRWGSYLSVLLDRDKPLSPQAGQVGVSHIADSEMARINIEASAALARWIDLMREDEDRYWDLVWQAACLPMTRRSAQPDHSLMYLAWLSQPGTAQTLASGYQADRLEQVRAEVARQPTRVLANALINVCWRNGPVEEIHAGQAEEYTLTQRRITPSEERLLVRTTADRLAQGLYVAWMLVDEKSERSWEERVLPFALASSGQVTPTGWTLDEQTRVIWLLGRE